MKPFFDVAFNSIKRQYYDDVADRLSYFYTTLILLFFALFVTIKLYVGEPIKCWVPAEFKGGWEIYADSYCFVQNTYFLPFEKRVPQDVMEREYRKIGYYQWVPVALMVQAILFYLPNLIWKWFNGLSGVNVKAILCIATDSVGFDPEKRQKNVETLARYIEDSLEFQNSVENERRTNRFCFALSGFDHRRLGNYLCCLYLLVKVFFLVNAAGQLLFLNHFLGTNQTFWGAQVLADLYEGREWTQSGHFPRVTMCDFVVQELAQTHKYTIQCVLVINMFNEKIYLFLWFWFFFVTLAAAVNLLWWLCSFWPSATIQLVRKYIRVSRYNSGDRTAPPDRRVLDSFVRKALRPDGVLLLRFISGHAGDLLTTELTAALFKDYMVQRERNAQYIKSIGTLESSDEGRSGFRRDRTATVDVSLADECEVVCHDSRRTFDYPMETIGN